jgi:hypothetical protein
LVFIGKLNVFKGADMLPEILIKSGASLPLLVAGDGELKDVLARAPGIELRGWVSNAESLQLLARAHALLFPSRWAEPLARTLLEAQALGVPTVACNTGGTRDIISDNFNGLLAENTDEFAAQLRRLMDDAELRARLSENSAPALWRRNSSLRTNPQFASCNLPFAIENARCSFIPRGIWSARLWRYGTPCARVGASSHARKRPRHHRHDAPDARRAMARTRH